MMFVHVNKAVKFWLSLLSALIVALAALTSCGSDDEGVAFTAEFSYEFIDDNNVRISNQSEGEYYLLDWNFGNGETASNSFKTKTYEVYYPEAGIYTVRLIVIDFEGERQEVSKDIEITKDDLVV